VQALDEGVDVLAAIVEGKRGAGGCSDTQAPHQGLGTVMAGADGDPLPVEDGADVVWMDVAEEEGEHARLLLRGPDEPKP